MNEEAALEPTVKDILKSKEVEEECQADKVEQPEQLLQEVCKKGEAAKQLTKASKPGDNEATEILEKPRASGDGIDNENQSEAELHVKTPESERRLKDAISELFETLKKEGHDTVSIGEIGNAIKQAKDKIQTTLASGASSCGAMTVCDEEQMEAELGLMSLLTNAMSVGGKDEVTMSEFMETAMAYAKGDVPELVTVLNEDDMEKYNKASVVGKVLQYPHQSLESFKHYVLLTISKRGSTWVKSLIPTAQIQTLLLLYLYNQLTPEMLWFSIPLIIFYISMTALVVFSLQMFHGREALKQLRSVSELMRKFDPMIDEKEAEAKFMWKSITPYICFFVSLVIAVAVIPLCDKSWIPYSELSIIAIVFTVSALRGLPSAYDEFAMYTIGLKVLTTVLRSLEGVRGLSILCHPLMSIRLPYGLEFHVSLPSILHVAILAMLVVMAGRNSWRGVYKVLIPHLVCLMWWQMFTVLFEHTTWRSLTRASLGWIILITMLPLLLAYIIGIFLLNFMQWFMTLDLAMKLAVTAIAIGISSVIILYSNIHLPKDLKKNRKFLLVGVAAVVIFLLGPILYVNYIPTQEGPSGDVLTWQRYDELCGPQAKAHAHQNEATLQASCSEFIGKTVRWTGRVTFVRVVKVENRLRSFVMAMPIAIRPTLRCLLGEDDQSEGTSEAPKPSGWILKRRASGDCSLMSFDKYTFLMGVEMTSSTNETLTLKVTVTHGHYNTMLGMTTSSTVTVKGRLDSGLGLDSINLSLKSLYVDGARVKPRGRVQREDIYAGLKQAGRYSVGFFFSPLVDQKHEVEEEEEED